jgi:hypothetical protein
MNPRDEQEVEDAISAGEPPLQPKSIEDEMSHLADEPLLPVEKKLIVGSLVLGVALLGVLLWVSATFFPPTPH